MIRPLKVLMSVCASAFCCLISCQLSKPVLYFLYLCTRSAFCLYHFFPSISQRERRDCAAAWLAAVSGACLSWLTYQWRPRICGRFPVNLSSWLRNWATASLEKSGWVGRVGMFLQAKEGRTSDAHLNQNYSNNSWNMSYVCLSMNQHLHQSLLCLP